MNNNTNENSINKTRQKVMLLESRSLTAVVTTATVTPETTTTITKTTAQQLQQRQSHQKCIINTATCFYYTSYESIILQATSTSAHFTYNTGLTSLLVKSFISYRHFKE